MTIILKKMSFDFRNMKNKKTIVWVTKDDVRITWEGGRGRAGSPKYDVFFCKKIVNGKFLEKKMMKKNIYNFLSLFFEERWRREGVGA